MRQDGDASSKWTGSGRKGGGRTGGKAPGANMLCELQICNENRLIDQLRSQRKEIYLTLIT